MSSGFVDLEPTEEKKAVNKEKLLAKQRERSMRYYYKKKLEYGIHKVVLSEEEKKAKRKERNRLYYLKKQQLEVSIFFDGYINSC